MGSADLRDSMAEWIDQKGPWEIWMTGTFDPEKSYKDTIRTKVAFGRFIGDLRKKYGLYSVEYFMAVERFHHGEFTHIHAVLRGLENLRYRQIGETWRERHNGIEQVEKYNQGKGANHYLTKYVTKELCDWGFNFRPEEKNLYLFGKIKNNRSA